MKKSFFIIAFVLLFAITSFAQTPVEDNDVVKISTTLIQVDVTVTDKKGKIVTDLKAEDFEVYENGEKQEITNFSFVTTNSAPTEMSVKTNTKDKLSVPVPPILLKPEQVRRTIALVIDDLGLSFESIYRVRRALRKFVDEQMQPNDLVAIIRTGGGIGELQQFTSDKRQLYAAIEAVKWNALGRSGISPFAPLEATPLELSNDATEEEDSEVETGQGGIQDLNDFREDLFSIGTLGAINFIVKGMSELPGRKSIMLFSDGFVMCSPEKPDRCDTVVDSVRQLTDLSNRAAVSIYSFDARGLLVTSLTAQDNTNGVSAQRIQTLASSRSAEIFNKQEGLAYLAEETGGQTFFNNNDINKGLDKALEDQKGYYLIGYQPDTETFDETTRRFNKLQIKVKKKDTDVRYRSGFFGVTDEQIKKPAIQTPSQQIFTALTSPFVINDIALRLNILFGNNVKQGSFARLLLHVNAKDLEFADEPGGGKKAVFDVLAVNFNATGNPIDQVAKTYTLKVNKDGYQKLSKEGFIYYFTTPVKNPGASQYRVVIRDNATGKVGTANQFVEIPDLKKKRLTASGIILENFTAEQWQKLTTNAPSETNNLQIVAEDSTNPMADTSLRKFKRNTILRYGFEVYNAKLNDAQEPKITTQVKIFHDGKPIFEGKDLPLELQPQTDLQRIKFIRVLRLGSEMKAGDYVLQIIVRDNLAKEKRKIATQFVQFELVE